MLSTFRWHHWGVGFPRSVELPVLSSRHLNAGRRLGSKQVSPWLVLECHPRLRTDPPISENEIHLKLQSVKQWC